MRTDTQESAKSWRRIEIAERFWPKVEISPDCWLWRGSRTTKGYGAFSLEGIVGFGRLQSASRVMWSLVVGPIPDGLMVCHTCDNPPCVRPSHLFLGTNKDNMVDMMMKRRFSSTPKKRLTVENVQLIRQVYKGRYGEIRVLARQFQVNESAIRKVLTKETWGWIEETPHVLTGT